MTTTWYSFDTSSLLNGRRDLLPPAVFPTLWEKMENMIANGQVRAIDVVREELSRRDDAVQEWAKAQADLFIPLEQDIQQATTRTLGLHPRLTGIGPGRNAADPFVIGLAAARGGIVVTEEKPSGRLNKPKIPDVCDDIGVPWMNLIGFVAAQGWSF